jgi:hypothetical protein
MMLFPIFGGFSSDQSFNPIKSGDITSSGDIAA